MRTFSFKRDKTNPMIFFKKIFLILLLIIPFTSKAQIGIAAGGTLNRAKGWIITKKLCVIMFGKKQQNLLLKNVHC